jgi:hypothetical protein
MQPSSAAAVELLIAERNASRIISRFNDSDDKQFRPFHAAAACPELPKIQLLQDITDWF